MQCKVTFTDKMFVRVGLEPGTFGTTQARKGRSHQLSHELPVGIITFKFIITANSIAHSSSLKLPQFIEYMFGYR